MTISSNFNQLMKPYKQAIENERDGSGTQDSRKANAKAIYVNANELYEQGHLHHAGKLFSYLTVSARYLLDGEACYDIAEKVSQIYHTLLKQLATEEKRVGQFAQTLLEIPHLYFDSKNYSSCISAYRDFRKKNENNKCIKLMLHPLHIKAQKSAVTEKWNFSDAEVKAYSASEQGPRPYQEDRILINENFQFSQQDKNFTGKIYAVFDGHGGSKTSQFLQDTFSNLLAEALSAETDTSDASIYNAITSAFTTTHYMMKQNNEVSGSTACVAFFLNGCIYTANCGDSRMIMAMDQNVYQVTQDDKITNKKLVSEIYQRGGKIQGGSVGGVLGMAKAIGDTKIVGIDPRPVIHKINPKELPQPQRACLVIASDGLWDVIPNKKAAELACVEGDDANSATELCSAALSNHSRDNVSAVVIYLTPSTQSN